MKKIETAVSNDFCPQTMFIYGTYKEDGDPDFGLFCWISYCWDTELGVMACIGGEKLTKDRIRSTKCFSANLVTEELLPLADYYGSNDGYKENKAQAHPVETERGRRLNVPILSQSPVSFELEVAQSIPLDDGEVFLCKIRNVLISKELADESESLEARMAKIAPVSTTCQSYFSWNGKNIGEWNKTQNRL
ncbi:MAG: flavin reductase [Butyrivibrio sp.]|nr:flavin reductase [Butyrivibrio sp.]